jgi:hypothetical protein
MARRTRTKKTRTAKPKLAGPTSPEQPQVTAIADPAGGNSQEEHQAMAAMAISGPSSPEQPQ